MSITAYSDDHEWVRREDDGTATVGITDYAQEQMGDVVYVELPAVGSEVTANQEAAVVESVKTAADVKMPVSGTVIAINERLTEAPELVNTDPMGEGWFLKLDLKDVAELDALYDEDAYQALIKAPRE